MNITTTITDTIRTLAYQWITKGMPDIYGVRNIPTYLGKRSQTATKREQLQNFRSWVYACVNARAKEIQSVEFTVMQKTRQNEFKEVSVEHPLVKILNDPNPYATKTEILYTSCVHLDLTGDCFWYTPLNGLGVPAEIWILPVDKVKIIPSKNDSEFISHYEVNAGLGKEALKFGLEEIVHLRYPNPSDPYYGMSVLQAAAYAADINTYQHEYQREFYRNFAVPDFALKTENKLDTDTRKRLAHDWVENYGGAKRKTIAILEAGLDVARLGVNPKELNWLADNKATMQEIAAIFGTPPSKIAQEDVPNRAVAETSDYTFSKNTIEPILQIFDERITQDLAREFDERLVVKHKSTVRGDDEKNARIDQIRISSGQITINESRQAQGFEPVDGGDEVLVPTSVQKLSALSITENV